MYRFELIYDGDTYDIEEPAGWTDLQLILRKNETFNALFFERTGNLKFYKEARQIILNALNDKHFEAEITFKAYKTCNGTESVFYEGLLSLNPYTDEKGLFECNIDAQDKVLLFNNNRDRKEDFTDCPKQNITLHPVKLQNTLKFVNDELSSVPFIQSNSFIKAQYVNFTTEYEGNDFDEYLEYKIETGSFLGVQNVYTSLVVKKDVAITIQMPRPYAGFSSLSFGTYYYRVGNCRKWIDSGKSGVFTHRFVTFEDSSDDFFDDPIWILEKRGIAETVTINFVAGDVIDFLAEFEYSSPASVMWLRESPFFCKNEFISTVQETDLALQAPKVFDVLNFLIDKASGGNFQLLSDYYSTGAGKNRIIASGFNLRNKTKMQASFKQVYEALDAIDNLALAYKKIAGVEYIRIEPKQFFYTSGSPTITLDYVDFIKTTLAYDKIFKLIDCGYQKWETEYLNGTYEPNSTRQFELENITQSKNTKKAISSLIAGSYLIEKQRRYRIKDTEDSQTDEDLFVIEYNPATNVALKYGAYDFYNQGLNPNANIENYQTELSASTVKGILGNLILKSKTGDALNVSPYTPISLNVPLFKCIYLEFDYPITMSQFEAMKNSPEESIELSGCDGVLKEAYLEEVVFEMARGIANFKLLLI